MNILVKTVYLLREIFLKRFSVRVHWNSQQNRTVARRSSLEITGFTGWTSSKSDYICPDDGDVFTVSSIYDHVYRECRYNLQKSKKIIKCPGTRHTARVVVRSYFAQSLPNLFAVFDFINVDGCDHFLVD